MSRVSLLILALICAASVNGSRPGVGRLQEIDAFNKRFQELHLKMDHAGILAMWAQDGVDLMPGEAPLVGKKAIKAWVDDIESRMSGHRVVKEDLQFHDIRVSGEWASEWAAEYQVLRMPDPKPQVEGYGKLALVLHREPNGEWKIEQEMWNDAPRP